MKEVDVKSLLNQQFQFYGATENCFKIDHRILEVIEDPEDGYRSMMDYVCEYDKDDIIFYPSPLDLVTIRAIDDDNYEIIGIKDNHRWLLFGTDMTDDYYPFFVFDYTPRNA